MNVYRLSNARRANDLSGTGARLTGGRWNRIGTPVLYTAGSRALATLEVLVHSPLSYVPDQYRMLTLLVPDDSLQTVPFEQLPDGWDNPVPPPTVRNLIEDWIAQNRFLVLKVPSAVVADEYNYLINPLHPRAVEVRIIDNQPYRFDSRLIG